MSNASKARYEGRREASRKNGKHSRGPQSQQGKRRSRQNAIRHGLSGRVIVLPTEDMEEYKHFSKEIVDSLDAQSPMERQYAQTIADSQWRLNRARTFEDGMIAMGHFEDEGDFNAECAEIHSALTAAKVFRGRSKDFANLAFFSSASPALRKRRSKPCVNFRPSAGWLQNWSRNRLRSLLPGLRFSSQVQHPQMFASQPGSFIQALSQAPSVPKRSREIRYLQRPRNPSNTNSQRRCAKSRIAPRFPLSLFLSCSHHGQQFFGS